MSVSSQNSLRNNSSSSIDSNSLNFTSLDESFHQDHCHNFYVYCLSTKKILHGKFYRTTSELRRDAFLLFDHADFNETNALVTYRDENNEEIVLHDMVPSPLPKNQFLNLFIRFIHPVCALCSGSFGIVEDQILFECPTEACGEQYCGNCVRTIQGDPKQWPIFCLSCRKQIEPQRNVLLEKHLIWSNLRLLYGTRNLDGLIGKSSFRSIEPLKRDVEFRRLHLRCHLNTLRRRRQNENLIDGSSNEFLFQIDRIHNDILQFEKNFRLENIDLEQIVGKHKQITGDVDNLCEKLTFFIEQLNLQKHAENEIEEMKRSYISNRKSRLSTEQNIESIDQSLLDVNARKQWLDFQLFTLENFVSKETSTSNSQLITWVEKGREKLVELDQLFDQLNSIRRTLRTIERQTEIYVNLLTDRQHCDLLGSRFILKMEKLRREIERVELIRNFPQTIELIDIWQNDRGIDENFQPKVLTMCQTVEKDLKNLLTDRRSIFSVPYRIGVVGHTSVGKSALIIALTGQTDFSSMISLERSTFGYLQLDNFLEEKEKIPLSFIDIAGATDFNRLKSNGDYLELITNADCDLYLLVFDQLFDSQNQFWFEFIEKTLNRKCFLVRSKTDLVFNAFYKTIVREDFSKSTSSSYDVRCTMEKVRQHAKTMWNQKVLDHRVFSTSIENENFGNFDLNLLKKQIENLAKRDLRMTRVCRLAVLTANTMINTCFRRSYVVSQTKYRWLAAGTSLIPFLDEIPAFFGREEIRQAFGIHDRSSLTNKYQKTRNSLEEYLLDHEFTVPSNVFKSGYFEYLISNEKSPNIRIPSEKTNFVSRFFRDFVRIATPTASSVFGIASLTGLFIGAVLTPIAIHSSYCSTGERMQQHLDFLCDDLQILMNYFIVNICDKFNVEDLTTSSASSSSDDEEF